MARKNEGYSVLLTSSEAYTIIKKLVPLITPAQRLDLVKNLFIKEQERNL